MRDLAATACHSDAQMVRVGYASYALNANLGE